MEGTIGTPFSAPEVALYPHSQQLDPRKMVQLKPMLHPKNPWKKNTFRFVEACGTEVCFSGSVLLETFDIEVVSYDGNSNLKVSYDF